MPVLILLLAAAGTPRLPAATVTLQQGLHGYSGAADAWMDESSKNDNNGGATSLRVQYNNGMSDCTLLRFALPSLNFQSVATATLGLYYFDQSSMSADNALWITPYRVINNMSWYENVYSGVSGYGVNWKYRDNAQTLEWTGQNAAWNDKSDDGNSMAKVKRAGGSVPEAIEPPNWVTWNVSNSVALWHGGQPNNGLVVYESGFEGSGYILAGLFDSRENGLNSYSPYLAIAYQGAQIHWSGAANGAWDTASANWNVGGYTGAYGNGDFVAFPEGASNPTITVGGGGVSPGSVTISNTSTAYSFTGGGINGAATLTKQGSGQASLMAANSYTGQTIVNKGTLLLGPTGSIANCQSITVNSGATLDVSTVTGGFILGGTANQTLKGSGSVAGNVTAANPSRMEPGNSVGTLTFLNRLTLSAGVTNFFELTNSPVIGGGTNDLIVVTGDLTVNSNIIAITVLGTNQIGDGTYRLFNYYGAKRGFFNPKPVVVGGPGVTGVATIDESTTNQVNFIVVTPVATSLLLTSSTNPSLPGVEIGFTATVSPVPPATNVPTGVVVFKTNEVPMGAPVELVGGMAQISTSELPHGYTTIRAEYAGGDRFLGSSNSLAQLVNTPPAPGNHFACAVRNQALTLSIVKLLSSDDDADSDTLTLLSASLLSTNGGTTGLVGGSNLVYLPRPDYAGSDRITYALSDGYVVVEVPVTIDVLSGNAQSQTIAAITNLGGGTVIVTFAGIPDYTYWVQMATNLAEPMTWATLATNTAGTNGLWQFVDHNATNAQQFYRTAAPLLLPAPDLFDAEILSIKLTGGGLPAGMTVRESPELASTGVTRIQAQDNGSYTISSFFDIFTELTVDGGVEWFPGTNGPALSILTGGLPPNRFPTNRMPPMASQSVTPACWTEFYPSRGAMLFALRDLRLHSFMPSFSPPPPGASVTNMVNCMTDLLLSFDGGHTFLPYSPSATIEMVFTGRAKK